MALRPVVQYAWHPEILRRKSAPVDHEDGDLPVLVRDLKDTLLQHADGVGLAAPQIGVHKRVIVVRFGANGRTRLGRPVAILNPTILEAGDELPDYDGCLSLPGLYGETVRPHFMRLRGTDERERTVEWTLEGFDAVVVHHEVDHLNGVLFIDRLSSPDKLYTETVAEGVNP